LVELAPRAKFIVQARNDLPSIPSDRAQCLAVSFDAFTPAMHARASASSRIFLRSIGDLQATSLHGPIAPIIPPSLMGHDRDVDDHARAWPQASHEHRGFAESLRPG